MPRAMNARGFRLREKYPAKSNDKTKPQQSCKLGSRHRLVELQHQLNVENQTNDQGL